MRENIKEIKKHLRAFGGLLITNRAVGKTQALLELLHEDEDSYILTHNASVAKDLTNTYQNIYNDGKQDRILADSRKAPMEKTYID